MKMVLTVAAVAFLGMAAPAPAEMIQEQQDLRATIEALSRRIEEQDKRLQELEAQQASPAATAPDTASEEYRQAQRQAIQDVLAEMKTQDKASKLPGWLDDLKFAGDLRLRYEYNGYNWGSTSDSDKKDRNRARYRLRFGVKKTWLDDQLEVGFRLASGENNDPTSTNQSFTQGFSKKPVWIDLAYARYTPKDFKGFSIIAGKMARPWITNDIFFDSDVNPEGAWAQYKAAKMGMFQPFAGAGYFVVNESSGGDDSTMYILQGGVKADITADMVYTFAANYQEWTGFSASGLSPRGNANPLSRIPGMRIVNLSNNLDVAEVFGKPLSVFGDFAYNFGEDDPNGDYKDQNKAFAAGVKWGKNKKKGDWSVKYRYGYVEANALPGAFVDSDFGFANRQGNSIGAEYNLLDSLTVGVDAYLTEPIFSPTTNSGSSIREDLTTTIMANLIWKF